MCSCELHDSSTALAQCSCICKEHDRFFPGDFVILRKAVRSANDRIYALQKAQEKDYERVTMIADDVQGRIAGVENALSRLQQDMGQTMTNIKAADTAISGIYHRLRGVEDELTSVNERLSPPEKEAAFPLAEDQEPLPDVGENKDVEPETLTGVVAPPPKMPGVVKLCHLPQSPMVVGSTCAECGHHSLAHSDYGPCATCVIEVNVHANTR